MLRDLVRTARLRRAVFDGTAEATERRARLQKGLGVPGLQGVVVERRPLHGRQSLFLVRLRAQVLRRFLATPDLMHPASGDAPSYD